MVKTTLVTSIAIIQFALLSQVSVGLPIADSSEQHCQSKRSTAAIGAGVGLGCGTLGAVVGTVGYLTRPPVPASAARAAEPEAHAEGEPAQREQGTTHGHTSDPDAITHAPPRPGEEPITSKKAGKAPITQQPGPSHMEYKSAVPEPEPAHLAQPNGGVKRRDLTRLVRRQPGRSLERREWDELRSRRLDSNSYLEELD